MRQAGRYLPEYRQVRATAGSFIELCLNPPLAAELTLQPIRRYGMDGAILFSDILMLPYALGQNLTFLEGEGPVLERIESPAEVAKLDPRRIVWTSVIVSVKRQMRHNWPASPAEYGVLISRLR